MVKVWNPASQLREITLGTTPYIEYKFFPKKARADFRVESGAHFEEARDAAPCADGADGGGGHAAEQLEEGAFAGAVTPDDSHDVALFHLENPMSESRGQTCLAMAER